MKEIESIEQYHKIIKIGSPVCVLFTAEWCPDCMVIKPILPELEEEFSSFEFVSVDRDRFIDLCRENDIFGIPSFVCYDQGSETGRFVSTMRKTKAEIQGFLAGIETSESA